MITDTEIIIIQGEDIEGKLTVLQVDGNALDMSGADDIYLTLHDGYGNAVAKFHSAGPAGDWYGMDLADIIDGILRYKVLTEVTKVLKPGRFFWELLVKYPSGSHPDDSTYDVTKKPFYAFTVKESYLRRLTLP